MLKHIWLIVTAMWRMDLDRPDRRHIEAAALMKCYWPSIKMLAEFQAEENGISVGLVSDILFKSEAAARKAIAAGMDAPSAADVARLVVMMETTAERRRA